MIAIFAILVAIWIYLSAVKEESKNIWGWVGFSVVLYYAVGAFWVYVILLPTLGRSYDPNSLIAGISIELSGILIALAAVLVIRFKFLRQSKKQQP